MVSYNSRWQTSKEDLVLQVDREGIVPLWRQIATGIRYRVALGRLRPGDLLPSLREAEALWGVSLHTVRQAYLALEREGLVEVGDRRRARIAWNAAAPAPDGSTQSLRAFAAEMVRTARLRYGAEPPALARAIQEVADGEPARVWVVECARSLAARLASQVEARLGTHAAPLTLADLRPPPHGVIVGTYYHHAEVALAAAEAGIDPVFLPVEIDPDFLERIRGFASSRLVLSGPNEESLQAMADDLRRALGGAIAVETLRSSAPETLLRNLPPTVPLVLTPESWDTLPERFRGAPNLVAHASRFTDEALDQLRARLDAGI